ncbi:MAG: hypothetical protein PS018_21805 [bacterium]|nr:hypothetical protein [bacterium]
MWDGIKAWFRHSLTIFWARVQWFVGIMSAGLIAGFSGYDFAQLTEMTSKDAVRMLCAVALAGVLTELARRRTL